MGGLGRLAAGPREIERVRSDFATFSLDEFGRWLMENGILTGTSLQSKVERVESNFPALLSGAYRGNSAVFALEMVRLLLFSEARFQFRQRVNGQPGDLFGTAELALLENPWGGSSTTGDMLGRLMLYSDFAGNAFAVRRRGRLGQPVIRLPRPDWMMIIVGTPEEQLQEFEPEVPFWDLDAELIGYQYHPGGIGNGRPVNLLPEEVAHFAPVPDPIFRFIGMSIWRAALTEIDADNSVTAMKLAYFSNGATPGNVVTINNPTIKKPEDLKAWIDLFEEDHKGATNRFKTLYLANGADIKVTGSNLAEADLSKTQGAGETRLASAAGIHPALAGFSEGLSGSSLNKGNIQELKRLAADKTFRPNWRNVAGSLATLVTVPGGSELWYDDRDIKFLAEDVKEAADILFVKAQAIKQLTDAGYEDQSVVDAVTSGDLSRLKHTGLFSVQLQKPGSNGSAMPDTPIPASAQSARAQRTFWTTGGVVSGRIIEGTCVRLDSPWVQSFPSMFEPSELLPSAIIGIETQPRPALLSARASRTEDGDPLEEVRCTNPACGKLLAEAVRGYYRGTCRHCKTRVEVDTGKRSEVARLGPGSGEIIVPPPDMSPVADAIRSLGGILAARRTVKTIEVERDSHNLMQRMTATEEEVDA